MTDWNNSTITWRNTLACRCAPTKAHTARSMAKPTLRKMFLAKCLVTFCFVTFCQAGFAGTFVAYDAAALESPARQAGESKVDISQDDRLQTDQSQASDELPATSDEPATEIKLPEVVDNFTPSITDHDLDETVNRAWEFRPYRVAVWLCSDGSPELNALTSKIVDEVTRRSELIDPSAWDLAVGNAPSQWRWRFLESIETPEKCTGFEDLPMLQGYDKLMIVCLNSNHGQISLRVREFDIQTQQWGPMLRRESGRKHQLDATIMNAVSVAFMPLARVDRVIEKNKKDEVFLQVRGVDACIRTEMDIDKNWKPIPNRGSPVFVKNEDRFLPVIRRTDRKGNLIKLEPIAFTFLTIDSDQDEGSELKCSIQSMQGAPLAGRTSKRAEKLALVIRPPQQPTLLYLESRKEPKKALEGFEIYSRRPGSSIEEDSEYLGKTDWRGMIEIPPSSESLRLIYVKRGKRALAKLPIIPGLYDKLVTTLPNDETSLFAEGILQGLQKEILSLVIQREVFESDIESFLEKENINSARE